MGAEIASGDVDIDVDVSVDIVWFEYCEEVGVASCTSMRNDSSSITVSLIDTFLEGYPPIEMMIAMCAHATAIKLPALMLREVCLLRFKTCMECAVVDLNNAIYHK